MSYDTGMDIVCYGDGGRRVKLYPPVLGTSCGRCSNRADDVSFLIEGPNGVEASGGLCGECLIPLLSGDDRARSAK